MGLNTFSGDFTFRDGAVNMSGATGLTVPAGSIGDASVTAVSPLGPTKTRRRISKQYSQVRGIAAVDETGRVVHVVYGAIGAVIAVRAGIRVAAVGDSTVTVDVKKNGTSILTSVMTISSSQAAFDKVAGSVSVPGLVAGDILEVVIDATVGTGTLPQGLFVDVVLDEDPA